MGSTKDFVAATVADAMLPWFRRPVEDVIYETIDKRQIPNRTDFKELRDLVNNLRGQLTGATGGVKRLAEAIDDIEDQMQSLETRTATLEAAIARLEAAQAARPSVPAVARTCKVPGCGGKLRAKGFCAVHYQRWRRGTLEGFPPPE